MTDTNLTLELVENTNSEEELRKFLKQAVGKDDLPMIKAIVNRLTGIQTSGINDDIKLAFWKSVLSLEEVLTAERGKTTTLARTRQKAERESEFKTIEDMAMKNPASDGYKMMLDRGMPELTFEAIVIRNERMFHPGAVLSAKNRLTASNVDIDNL